MSEEAQSKVQTAIKKFINEVDYNYLRRLEKIMHECAANCLSNNDASIDEVHACVEKCQEPTLRAQRFVQSELERFQEGLNRCIIQCQEDIKDQISPNASDSEIARLRCDFETCAHKCCDLKISKLPSLSKKVMETLSSGNC